MSDPEKPVSPKRLGDFELLRELGRGGMGVVYVARQISLNRHVALKVLPPALGLSSQAKQRFQREARAAARLHHANIVPVHAIGEQGGHHFYAMDLIDGQSLDRVLHDLVDEGSNPLMETTITQTTSEFDPLPGTPSRAKEDDESSLSDASAGSRKWFVTVAKLIADVADGLHYAHGRGVIHRDIKPANLMLSREGHLCITDFGLARMLEEPGMTITGSLLGTPAYMSPEQIAAGRINVDHRTDIYSLGAVLYELLTMQRPFPGDSRERILSAVLTKDPRPPRRVNRRIPVDLETICLKALEKDPDRRYPSAGELAQDLRRYLHCRLIAARRAGLARQIWKAIRRHPTAAMALLTVVLVASIGGASWRIIHDQQIRQRVSAGVAEARRDLDAGLYRDGLEKIDHALDLAPDDPAARLLRARLLAKADRKAEAVREAEAIIERDPDEWIAHLVLATLGGEFPQISVAEHQREVERLAPGTADAYYARSLMRESASEKLGLLTAALERDPAHAEALLDRIKVHMDRFKDSAAALDDCERLITARPKSAQGWRMKARVHAALTLEEGQERFDWKQALAAVDRAIEIDSNDAETYDARAWIQRGMGRRGKAVEDMGRAVELNPSRSLYLVHRAQFQNEMGQFERAIADARGAIEVSPDSRGAYKQLFRALLARISVETEPSAGESEVKADAHATLRRELEELGSRAEGWADPKAKVDAYLIIADYYRQLKDYGPAMEWIELANPDEFEGFLDRMELHKELGDDAAAEADCDAAARIDLDEPESLRLRGRGMSRRCNRHERSIEDFDRVIELVPKWHAGYLDRGTAYLLLQRYDEALADLNKAIELNPHNVASYNNRSIVHQEQRRYEDALADKERALDLTPHCALCHTNYGTALLSLGRVQEALAAHERALELAPRHGLALAHRGAVLAWLGRCKEAAAELQNAEEVDRNNPTSRGAIVWAHTTALYYNCPSYFDEEVAMRHARSAYDDRPERQRPTLAYALLRNGDHAEAKRISMELYDEDPNYAWFMLVISLWQLGEQAEARSLFDESVAWQQEHLPDSPILTRERQEAAAILGLN